MIFLHIHSQSHTVTEHTWTHVVDNVECCTTDIAVSPFVFVFGMLSAKWSFMWNWGTRIVACVSLWMCGEAKNQCTTLLFFFFFFFLNFWLIDFIYYSLWTQIYNPFAVFECYLLTCWNALNKEKWNEKCVYLVASSLLAFGRYMRKYSYTVLWDAFIAHELWSEYIPNPHWLHLKLDSIAKTVFAYSCLMSIIFHLRVIFSCCWVLDLFVCWPMFIYVPM